jgi:hypothetical protein
MSPESGKTITLRYPGRCAVCGRELRRGDRGVWYQGLGGEIPSRGPLNDRVSEAG